MPDVLKKGVRRATTRVSRNHDGSKPIPVILVVGESPVLQHTNEIAPQGAEFRFANLSDISREMLDKIQPDIVLSPLWWATSDCMDLARVLDKFKFRGVYRILTKTLPDPSLILTEIREHFPDINVDFVFVGPEDGTTLN